MQTWRLDGGSSTLVLASGGGIPEVIYWGRSLPISEDLATLAHASSLDVTGGMLDSVPALSLCPQAVDLFPGQPGLTLRDIDGRAIVPDFKLDTADISETGITFECVDDDYDYDIALRLEIACDPETGVLTLRTHVICQQEIRTIWVAAPTLPLPYGVDKTIEFAGKWTGEFQRHENPMTQGARLRESNTGRSGHETFPALIVPSDNGCMGFHYGWSGGHKMVSAQLSDGRRYVQFGNATNSSLIPHHFAASEKLYAVWAETENDMAAALQKFARKTLCRPYNAETPHPVHYNCWEAIYFDHNIEVLKDIATRAAALGAERFVLDDGWFGNRDDDTSSLGDWDIDRRKYPDGLTPLIDHVQSEGMRFGIWFEPEMVNKESQLYNDHPEWVLGGDEQPLGRNQLTLNLDHEGVTDYLFDKIHAVLDEYDIDYVKWDHNRVLPLKDDGQTRAFYRLIDALKRKHPNVDFESCASGGGRIDYGVLEYCSRVWLSDSNDALERWRMQTSASAFLPNEIMGSHVGPRICHTSGRILPMQFRAWVAASRHMGFEMDPRELTDEDAEILKEVTTWYKMNRDWLHAGTIHNLPQTDPATMGEIQIAEDGSRFVAMMAQMTVSDQVSPHRIRLTGLDPDQSYQVSLRNPQDAATVSRGNVALRAQPVTLSGRALMDHGVQTPNAFPATMWVIEGHAI